MDARPLSSRAPEDPALIEPLKKEVTLAFDDAVRRVEAIVKEGGFSVLLTKSVDEILVQKLGLPAYPRYTMILACAPDLAKMALDVATNVGTLYPCSFTVSEEEGHVYVAHLFIMKVDAAIGLAADAAMAPVIRETEKRVAAVWNRL
jgi:uncharacterized protein (DUF302 family)